MRYGRALSIAATTGAIAGCAALVFAMGANGLRHTADNTPSPSDVATTSIPPVPTFRHTSAIASSSAPTSIAPTTSAAPTQAAPVATTSAAPPPAAPATTRPPAPAAPRTTAPAPAPAPPAPVRGVSLPLGYSTGDATRVITVTAPRTSSTTATLQAWQLAPGGGWLRYGSAVTAHIGSQGMTTAPSESKSATPIGSFTLTQAFGINANPGTGLPYFRATSADYWISSAGSLYNTHQSCPASNTACYNNGVNERLGTIWQYGYAVVIDYNTANAPGGVRQGAGSAFFLHITDGGSTAGCVAIPQANLVQIMQWLTPAAHPRILIGIG